MKSVYVDADGNLHENGGTYNDASFIKYADDTTAEFQKQKMASDIAQNASDIANMGDWELISTYTSGHFSNANIRLYANKRIRKCMWVCEGTLVTAIGTNGSSICQVPSEYIPKYPAIGCAYGNLSGRFYTMAIAKNPTNATIAMVNGYTATPVNANVVGSIEWFY